MKMSFELQEVVASPSILRGIRRVKQILRATIGLTTFARQSPRKTGREFTIFSFERRHSDLRVVASLCYFGGDMRKFSILIVLSLFGLCCLAQEPYEVGISKDARAAFAAIAPYYNHADPNLKPWHLKVNYQLDDEKGNPSEQGVFEYWWAAPNVDRSTWRRGGSTHSEWHTADGRHLIQATGEPLGMYEYWLQSALLSPLPAPGDLDPARSILVDDMPLTNSHSRCMMVVPAEISEKALKTLPFGTYPEYCVNKSLPILLGYYRFGTVLVKCLNTVHTQGKAMPREILMIDQSREILESNADPVDMIAATDPALMPPTDATQINSEVAQIDTATAQKLLEKKVTLEYPEDAKGAHVQGKVILRALIGSDGTVQDVRLVSTPAASLALSAFHSVSQWHYAPYRVNGKPTVVETTVEVDFTLAG